MNLEEKEIEFIADLMWQDFVRNSASLPDTDIHLLKEALNKSLKKSAMKVIIMSAFVHEKIKYEKHTMNIHSSILELTKIKINQQNLN